MANDPLEELKRRRQQPAAGTDPLEELRRRRMAQTAAPAPEPVERPVPERGTLRSLGTAIMSGAVPISEATMAASAAAAELLTTGDLGRARRMYQSARRDVAREQEAAKRQLGTVPYEATKIAAELTSLAKAPKALAGIGSRVLGQAAPTAVRGIGMAPSMGQRALEFGGVEAARGISRAGIEREEAPSLGETALEGVKGFAAGTTGAMLGEGILRGAKYLPFGLGTTARGVGAVVDEASTLGQRAGRRGADALRSARRRLALSGRPALQQASQRAAGIIEPTDITRIRGIVGKELPVTGQVAEEFVEAGRQAGSIARASERMARGQQREAAAAAENEFRQALVNLRERAQSIIGGRPRPGMGGPTGEQLQKSIRAEQLARGNEGYALAKQLGATPDPEVAVPAIIEGFQGNTLMRRLYREAQQETASRGGGVVAQLGSGEKARKFRVVDLEGFDKMRQQVQDRVMSVADKDVVGSRRTMMRDLYERIDKMEEGFLASLPEEAGKALREVRADYARYFRELEALRDGTNLGFFGVGKKVGKIQQAPMSITQLERQVQGYTPRQMSAFRAGASEWLDSVIQKSPDDALKVAKKLVGTEENIRRTRLAMGDEFADNLVNVVRQGESATRRAVPKAGAVAVPQRDMAEQAKLLGRQMGAAQRAVRNEDEAAAFLRAFRPQMGAGAQQQARQVMASEIDRMLAGKSPREAIALLNQMRMNSAVKDMLGTEIDRAIQLVGSGTPLRRPLMSAIGAQIGGSLGRNER